jgi:EmrB/QacA subfamily drug resistance transporter
MSTHAPQAIRQHGAHPPVNPRRWRALTLLGIAQFMLILDITVVTIALPDIGADLHLTRASLTWVITAYTVLFGGLMLFGGRTADLFGARRTVLIGLITFTVASLVSGLAVNAAMLIGGRIGQGIGAALLSPAALSIITTTFHGPERTKALGIWAALGGTGSAVGVLLGGVLTAGPGWEWIFYINVPIGLAVLALLPAVLPAHRTHQPPRRVDLAGALLVTAGTGAAIYGLINAGDHGWSAPSTLWPLAGALVAYAGFALVERTVRAPLMNLGILTRRPVLTAAFLMLVATGLLIAGFFLGSFFLQQVRGYGALTTGLLFLPVAVGTVIGAQAASHGVGHLGPRPLSVAALLLAALGAVLPALWSDPAVLVTGISIAAAGLGATFVAATTTGLAHVAHHEAGLISGIINTFHELGAATGVAVISTVAAVSIATGGASTTGFTNAFTVSAITAAAAALVALLLVPAGKPPAGVMPHAH